MRWLALALALLLPVAALAQEDDRSRLTRLLEEQLSSDGTRQVSITGFRGALSSEARLDRLTVADADGVWLILEDATLVWTRTALLRGALRIERLTAARLEILRPPLPVEGLDLPAAEATPFALPDLPVSIDIGETAIAEVVLGPTVIGQQARLSVSGTARLADGAGSARLTLDRLDGPRGQFALEADYDNATRNLALDLLLDEDAGGIAAELLGLPGRPDLRLSIAGQGPLTDFRAEIALATGGEDRLAGSVVSTRGADGAHLVEVDIGGDISPLLQPDYRAFFGDAVEVRARVRQAPEGGTELQDLRLATAALLLEGDLAVDDTGLLARATLSGRIAPPAGNDVRLPAGGVEARLEGAALSFGYDRAEGEHFALEARIDRLSVDDLSVATAALSFDGVIALEDTGFEGLTARLAATVDGVGHRDPAMARAIGEALGIGADLTWIAGAPVILSDLAVVAGDVTAGGGISARAETGRLDIGLDLRADVGTLARFADIAGQPLDGAASLVIGGRIEALSGAFDLRVSGTGRDLLLAEAVPAAVFAGETVLSARALRDQTGLRLEDLRLENAELSLLAQASLSAGDTSASTRFRLEDAGLFTDLLSGPVAISADIARSGTDPFDITADLSGPNRIRIDLGGTYDAASSDFALDMVASASDLDLGDALPPGLLAGRTDLTLRATRHGEDLALTALDLRNPEIAVTGDASLGPEGGRADLRARLADVGLFTDALSGPVTADAAFTRAGDGPWVVDADLGGPGGMRAAVDGRIGLPDAAVDLTAVGQAPLELANRYITPQSIDGGLNFDLVLRGRPGLGAVSGTLTGSGARIALPDYALAIQDVGLSARLAGTNLTLSANGGISTGGRLTVEGAINLASAGLPGTLTARLADARLVDPTLYEARIASADLSISGPLARGPRISGRIALGESEIRVPEASLGGSGAIPDMRHLGETPQERLTREFAGLLGTGGTTRAGSAATELDVTIAAPGRIFLRGRGIDAEFGGAIRLFGTTANVIPSGQFSLIRGRLSVLGTRLDFTEGSATLQGNFDPFLRLSANSRAGAYRISIGVTGPASRPEITFSSDPSLPQDEVLAQLLFGRSVSGLSPLQLLQLADAATSLAGGSTSSGFIAGLRDGLGLDDLDLSTDAEGNAAVTAGRYLSENIYTDVTINSEGAADLSLNIDLTPSITARGSVGSGGDSRIGIFFEQDY